MKKVLAVAVAAGVLAAASFASAASIVGSKHDMSSSGSATSISGTGTSTQICVYCHAPHNANLSLPLWNRANPTAANFVLYSGVNMQNVSFKSGFTTDSTSLFCMSCHDGATAISAVYNAGAVAGDGKVGNRHTATAGIFATGTISGVANLTTNLAKTHPVNFPVSMNTSQSDLNVGSGSYMGPGVAAGFTWTGKTYPLFKTTDADPNRSTTGRSLECGSCHAVHDSANSPFLRYTMTRSELCLGCHNK